MENGENGSKNENIKKTEGTSLIIEGQSGGSKTELEKSMQYLMTSDFWEKSGHKIFRFDPWEIR